MKQHGYAYIEESVGKFLVPDKNEKEFENILNNAAGCPLPIKACNGFIPKELKSVGPEAAHNEILKYAETTFQRAQKAGVEIIFSERRLKHPKDFREKLETIHRARQNKSTAAKYNVLSYWTINSTECNFINSVSEGEIVEEINHSNFRLLVILP